MRSRPLALLFVCAASTSAQAFNSPTQFYDLPSVPHVASTTASAEGIYFTGAPRFAGQTCSSCHVEGPQAVTISIGAAPASLFSDGYDPGGVYELEVQLQNETRGTDYATPTCTEPRAPNDKYTYVPCNNNNFALEIDALAGPLPRPSGFCAKPPVGGVCPAPTPSMDEVEVAPGGDAVFANQPHSTIAGMQKMITMNGQTRWRFWWTAPTAGAGPLTLYVGAVDGNGGDGTTANDQDPYDDDTVAASITIKESGAPFSFDASAGCSLHPASRTEGRAGLALMMSAFLLLGLGLGRGRRAHRSARRAFSSSESA